MGEDTPVSHGTDAPGVVAPHDVAAQPPQRIEPGWDAVPRPVAEGPHPIAAQNARAAAPTGTTAPTDITVTETTTPIETTAATETTAPAEAAAATDTPAHTSTTAAPRVPGPADAVWAPPPSSHGRPRRRAVVAIVAGATALVLVVVAAAVGISTGRGQYAPERPVQAFLTALRAGHVTKALRVAHTPVPSDDALLTDAGYATAADRVTGARILGSSTSGDTATVRVDLEQGGRTVPASFDLERTGTAWGVFPTWRMQPLTLGTVDVVVSGPAGTPIMIGGASTSAGKDGSVSVAALPGTYAVALPGSTWTTARSASATVVGFGAVATAPVDLATTLTDAGRTAATDAVDAWVDGCVASTDLAPAGCSFSAYGEDPTETYSDQRWTLDTRPVVSIGDWTGSGWRVATTTPGAATYTAHFTGPYGSGTGTAGPVAFTADGTITAFTDAGATFTPAVTNGSGSGSSS